MSGLFSYFNLGVRALQAAQLGLQVAGDNIANVNTPGFARRRVELTTGFPVRVPGGTISHGVDIQTIRRIDDRLTEAALQRERGFLGFAGERLRALRDVETAFGQLGGEGITSAYAAFTEAFERLAGQPEDIALRRHAVDAADRLASRFRSTFERLRNQRKLENEGVADVIASVNNLSEELGRLNRLILAAEADGSTAAPLRDQRQLVLDELTRLTGGHAAQSNDGQVGFALPNAGTLVTGPTVLQLATSTDVDGMLRISLGANDVTDRLRRGELGGRLAVRDDTIPGRVADLDVLARDLIDRASALTTSGTDLNGNRGVPLFGPRAVAPNDSAAIRVNPQLLQDPRLLAVSTSGAPGDGTLALSLAGLPESASVALGNRSPAEFLSNMLVSLGGDIARTDVDADVARELVDDLIARREAISGVSLDEEAVDLLKFQRAFEASARFIQAVNEITEITVNLV